MQREREIRQGGAVKIVEKVSRRNACDARACGHDECTKRRHASARCGAKRTPAPARRGAGGREREGASAGATGALTTRQSFGSHLHKQKRAGRAPRARGFGGGTFPRFRAIQIRHQARRSITRDPRRHKDCWPSADPRDRARTIPRAPAPFGPMPTPVTAQE